MDALRPRFGNAGCDERDRVRLRVAPPVDIGEDTPAAALALLLLRALAGVADRVPPDRAERAPIRMATRAARALTERAGSPFFAEASRESDT